MCRGRSRGRLRKLSDRQVWHQRRLNWEDGALVAKWEADVVSQFMRSLTVRISYGRIFNIVCSAGAC